MKNEIILGDCLEEMELMPSGIFDLILCDLPYGTTANKWDSIIELKRLWGEYLRLIKPNGVIVLTAAQPFTSILVSSNLSWFKYDFVWIKPKATNFLNAKKQPLRDKEDILVFYKKQPTYNPQFTTGKPYAFKMGKTPNGKAEKRSSNYGDYKDLAEANDGRRCPKQTLYFNTVQRGTLHPTQKPVDLFEWLIRTYTNENDLVLDNCAGSGTTGVACLNTGRNYVLIEKEKEYYDKAVLRLEARKKELENELF